MVFFKNWFSGKIPDMNFFSLDIMRGLGALWVLLWHSIGGFPHYFNLGISLPIDVLHNIMTRGIRGIDIFFVVSGYCICGSAQRNINTQFAFLKQRIKRIYPPYWISILLGIVIVLAFLSIGRNSQTPKLKDLLLALPLLHTFDLNNFNAVYWTLPHMMHFYLVTFLAILLFRKYFIYMFDILSLSLIIAQVIKAPSDPSPLIFNSDSSSLIYQLCLLQMSWFKFYCGVLVFRIIQDLHKRHLFYHLTCLVLVLYLKSIYTFGFNKFTLYFTIFLLIIRLFDKKTVNIKFLSPLFKLGTISYSLYLTHFFFAPRIMFYVGRITTLNNYKTLLVLFGIVLPVTIGFAYYFYQFFEQPFNKKRFFQYNKFILKGTN